MKKRLKTTTVNNDVNAFHNNKCNEINKVKSKTLRDTLKVKVETKICKEMRRKKKYIQIVNALCTYVGNVQKQISSLTEISLWE